MVRPSVTSLVHVSQRRLEPSRVCAVVRYWGFRAKTLMQAQRNGATNRALITPAYNITSTGLYLNNGLYPREPLYRMSAPAQGSPRPILAVAPTRSMTEQFWFLSQLFVRPQTQAKGVGQALLSLSRKSLPIPGMTRRRLRPGRSLGNGYSAPRWCFWRPSRSRS
jgi:hypothetical protein